MEEKTIDQRIAEQSERFKKLCSKIDRKGIDDLMRWLESSDFYKAPASTRFHGNYRGGLLEHSLNVYDELMRLIKAYPEINIRESSAIIMALFHDLTKVNFYSTEKRNRKNADGKWESYDAYTINEKLKYGGHGSKSVFIVQGFIPLEPVEAVAINCHMGAWDGNKEVGGAYEAFPAAWLLHVADEAASYVKEGKR